MSNTPESYTLKHIHSPSDIDLEDRFARSASPDFDDPNFDKDEAVAGILDDDSPYLEVRSAVANTDDPNIPVNTIRAWVLGLIFAVIIPVLNQFFFFRHPAVTLSGLIAQLLIFPLGWLWARVVPNNNVFGISLNPGPFSIKEHVLATIMASVASPSAYATNIIAVQQVFYKQTYNFGYQWLLIMSTQLIGFSIGGICRRVLVDPPSMIWPSNLATCTLFNTLHGQTYAGIGQHGGISRHRFFSYCFVASAVWYLVPGYFFQALSYFSWVCWIAPDNVPVNEMFGYIHGMGMSLVTFDWSHIAYLGSPLMIPWWSQANTLIGFIFFYWFLTPFLHYMNIWSGKYMPISSSGSYDNRGHPYNVSRILNDDLTFNQQRYEAYSPLFIPTAYAVTYGLAFASMTSTVIHAVLYFRKQIWTQLRRAAIKQPDIHARLMSHYPQVPEWWYATVLLTMFAFGVTVIEGCPTQLPIQWFILALALAFFSVIPIGMIQALTATSIPIGVLTELIIGYGLPGRPIALMMFKTWGYNTMYQALAFTSDFKLGHYMKIPPRSMFWAQIVATITAGTIQLGVQAWMFGHIAGICDPSQKDGFTCPGVKLFGTASIIWGVIGPERQLSKGQVYHGLLFFFVIGALCPLLAYILGIIFPKSWVRYINFPVLFNTSAGIPLVSTIPFLMVGKVQLCFVGSA